MDHIAYLLAHLNSIVPNYRLGGFGRNLELLKPQEGGYADTSECSLCSSDGFHDTYGKLRGSVAVFACFSALVQSLEKVPLASSYQPNLKCRRLFRAARSSFFVSPRQRAKGKNADCDL